MNFIEKIFKNQVDEDIHKQFTRFSKGTFEDRALTRIKKTKNKITVKVSYDLSKFLVEVFSDLITESEISGKLVKKGKKSEINEKVNSEQLKTLLEENDYCLIDTSTEKYKLKCKKAVPKPGKALDTKFCSATLPMDKSKEFLFDTDEDFKDAEITHTFIIEEIVVPKEYENNPEEARLNAKRKGKLIRKIILDDKETVKEKEIEI
ncbi:hypothetical protein CL617_04225 [archaeon]|nr:hypothetical protein [archaeon]|tara:strand:- start:912 stop:1529 length:618 start_codon:yes stop_codon:yes gene_type:complete